MALTHTVLSVTDNIATVQFMNEANEIHVKEIIVPEEANGDLESEQFLNIIEGQKRSLEKKSQAKVIAFSTPG